MAVSYIHTQDTTPKEHYPMNAKATAEKAGARPHARVIHDAMTTAFNGVVSEIAIERATEIIARHFGLDDDTEHITFSEALEQIADDNEAIAAAFLHAVNTGRAHVSDGRKLVSKTLLETLLQSQADETPAEPAEPVDIDDQPDDDEMQPLDHEDDDDTDPFTLNQPTASAARLLAERGYVWQDGNTITIASLQTALKNEIIPCIATSGVFLVNPQELAECPAIKNASDA